MAGQSDDTVRSRRFYSERNAKSFSRAVKGSVNDLRSQPQSKSNFKVSYTKGNAKNRTDLDGYDGSNVDDDFEENTGSTSDSWESNCDSSDVPDYIEEGTAHFDEEGNYAGGTMADQSEN